MARLYYAFCYASGVIDFKAKVPDGALAIAHVRDTKHNRKKLRAEIGVLARHAYDNKTLLVPGIPEAPDQRAGIKALQAFQKWAQPILLKKGIIV